jgi:hypothetical protein
MALQKPGLFIINYELIIFILFVAAIAQLVEHWIVIPVVAGSSPVGRPTYFLTKNHKIQNPNSSK